MNNVIEVKDLHKAYYVPDKKFMEKANYLVKIFYRKYIRKEVLKGISFNVQEGEIIGYIGRNGAGKTTTVKILSGILSYDRGYVRVLGMDPYKERKELGEKLSVVFGNRDVVFFDIPLIDSLRFYKRVYNLDDAQFEERVKYLAKLLKMKDLLNIPLRKMSFGQRRKANVLASFLNKPKIVLLDEPTIGLDIFAKEEMRMFLEKINKKESTSIILTSHYMEDIERLADRIILLDNGTIIEDKPYEDIIEKFEYKIVKLVGDIKDLKKIMEEIKDYEIVEERKYALTVAIHKKDLKKIVNAYSKGIIEDLEIRNPSLEEILKKVYYNA